MSHSYSTTVMPWGKHKGKPLDTIESSYLCWCVESADALRPQLRAAIKAELAERFGKTAPPPPSSSWSRPCPDPTLAAEVVATGFKALARKHHPDVGGSTATMQKLNAVMAWLRSRMPQ